jgi:adenosylcobalamin-dependent ribonucleoside-triphosphate reductase
MGTPLTRERKLHAALNNCGFVSTDALHSDPTRPFSFLMDASMLGIGVGFDTKGAGQVHVSSPCVDPHAPAFVVPDSREGWVHSVELLLSAFLRTTKEVNELAIPVLPTFDYSLVRGKGEPIKGFGGTSQGPEILVELHESLVKCLSRPAVLNQPLSVTTIVDIMNLIGRCVVAGNIRRTAEIAFGEPDSTEFARLKDYEVNPERAAYGWTSNNSIYAELGMNYSKVVENIVKNGEPGFAWLENMQAYGRMKEPKNYKDHRAQGGNPCLEQTLESFEMCCLVETFPARHDSKEAFQETLRLAYIYAKVVTLGEVHIAETREVMNRNRRIGTSMSGLAQFVAQRGEDTLQEWCDTGYNTLQDLDVGFSKKLQVPESIKMTSIKPSGTVSLLAGATPGLHFPEARTYIRRIRLAADSPLVPCLIKAGFGVEPAVGDEERTVVVSIPVDAGSGVRTLDGGVSMWEQLSFAAFLQRHWADNQVSCTVTFDPITEGPELASALDHFQHTLKGISFLPRLAAGAYAQMPYESISHERYGELKSSVGNIDFSAIYDGHVDGEGAQVPDQFCDSTVCEVEVPGGRLT